MKSKGFEIAIYALMAALIVSLFTVSLTYGRYADEIESSGSDYDSNIEYIVSEKVEVHNMEEFIGAIENGYSNVYIADDADEEIIITTGVTDVSVDLIINLNGHTIVRNNRDPILNVQDGIRLTVTDTSTKKTGSFYNPVGSVLQISGGTLTVTGGLFESGPRKEEYGAASGEVNVKVFVKKGSEYEESKGTISMPDLTGDSTGIYYENEIPGNKYVKRDTYLYYSEEDSSDPVSVKAERGSADFYYEYYTSGGTRKIIFGYNNVKEIMSVKGSDYPSFAAVDIDDGNMYSRGGEYRSYFGVETAYGIDAAGGYMAVEDGTFSAIEAGTCIRCDYAAVDNYAEVADSEYLRISGGTYNSQWGNTVEVTSGKLVLENGIFIKDATNNGGDGEWSAAIRLIGGAIDGTEALAPEFKITGNNVYGIYADGNDSSIDIKNPTFTFDGDPEFTFNGTAATGIYSSAGKITVANGAFEMNGADENHGVHATGGATITLTDTEVDVKGTNSSGVRSEGGAINAENLTVIVTIGTIGENQTNINTTAISSEGGDITLTGKTVITSDALGITARGGNRSGNINIGEIDENGSAVGSMTLTTSRGTAVYLNGGKLNLNASFVDITSTIDENCVWGVENATKPYSYDGIRIEGGSLVSNAGTTFTLVHKGVEGVTYSSADFFEIYRTFVSKSYAIRVTGADDVTLPNGTVTNSVGGGIYVSGGNVTLGKEGSGQKGFTVSATGEGSADGAFITTSNIADNWQYKTPTSGGNAVEVRGGNLTINSGSYTAKQGNGIVVAGGENIINNGYFAGADAYNYKNQIVAGPGASYCLKVFGGSVTVKAGTFGVKDAEGAEEVTTSGAFISGTSEAQQGTATILGGTFKVDGQAGFSIFDYANVKFEPKNDSNNAENDSNKKITVSGTAAGIAVENRTAPVTITIHGGTFASTAGSGNSDGIWYANSNAKLTITGGTFTGATRAGLCFDKFPDKDKVKLSGGTYKGKFTEHGTWRREYYKFGAIGYDAKDYGVIIYDQLQLSAILAEKAKVYDVNNNVIDNNAWIHRDVSNNEKLEILSN